MGHAGTTARERHEPYCCHTTYSCYRHGTTKNVLHADKAYLLIDSASIFPYRSHSLEVWLEQ